MTLYTKTATELQELLHKREVSVKEITEDAYKRIADVDGDVQAFLTLTEQEAKARAEKLDNMPEEDRGVLFGLPIGIKDNIVTKGTRTTCASKMLEDFVPVYNATVVDRIDAAGGVSIGKLNMDEFAMGSTTEQSAFQATRNPWNLGHVPGGSSGGSAAAVAAGEVALSLGTDTGGSVRQPAAFCGLVGMKPTYGRISRYGLVAFASSLDQIGPLSRTVEDNALLLGAIAGNDDHDFSSSSKEVPDYRSALTGDIKGLKVAVPKEFFGEGIAEDVKASVRKAIDVLESLGASIEEVDLPHAKYGAPTYYAIACAEASSNLARFDGIRYGYRAEGVKDLEELYFRTRAEGFGPEVKKRILYGTYALSADQYEDVYVKAMKVRALIAQDFERLFKQYDVIVGPTSATTAYELNQTIFDPLTLYANDILTVPVNLAGVPAISVPCGLSGGLPIGLQFIGNHFDEATLYKVAHAYEQAAGFTGTPVLGEGMNR